MGWSRMAVLPRVFNAFSQQKPIIEMLVHLERSIEWNSETTLIKQCESLVIAGEVVAMIETTTKNIWKKKLLKQPRFWSLFRKCIKNHMAKWQFTNQFQMVSLSILQPKMHMALLKVLQSPSIPQPLVEVGQVVVLNQAFLQWTAARSRPPTNTSQRVRRAPCHPTPEVETAGVFFSGRG